VSKRQIETVKDKMVLVAAVHAKWPTIGRNAILSFTMESMREALLAKNPAALAARERGDLPCVTKGCEGSRAKGLAVCAKCRAAYVKSVR
jgi:hypothetical protein